MPPAITQTAIEIAKQAEGKSDRTLLIIVVCFAFVFLVGMVIRMERYIRDQMKEAREQTRIMTEALTSSTAMLDRVDRTLNVIDYQNNNGGRKK